MSYKNALPIRLGITLLLVAGLLGIAPVAARYEPPAGSLMYMPMDRLYLPLVLKGYTSSGAFQASIAAQQWNSLLALQNPNTSDSYVQVAFYDEYGGEYIPTLPGGNTLAGGASWHISMADLGGQMPDGRYSVVVSSDQPLAGATWVQGQDSTSGAESHGMYLGTSQSANTAYLPSVVKGVNGYNSSLSIQNLSSSPASAITVDFYDQNGSQVGQVMPPSPIPPYASWYLDLGTVGSLPSGYSGAAVVTSADPIVVVDSQLGGSAGYSLKTHSGVSAGATTFYAPELYDNFQGYASYVLLQNTSNQPAQVEVQYSDGMPPDGAVLNPNGSYTFAYYMGIHGAPFNATIISDQPIVATVAVEHATGLAYTYEAFAGNATGYDLPITLKGYGSNFNTSILVYNPGATAADVTITYEGYQGEAAPHTVGPQQVGYFPTQQEGYLPSGWNGSAAITSDQPIVALVGAFSPQTAGNAPTVIGDGQAVYRGHVHLPPLVTMDKTADKMYVKPGERVFFDLTFDVNDEDKTARVTDVLPGLVTGCGIMPGAGLVYTPTGSVDYAWDVLVPAQGGFLKICAEVTATVSADTVFTNTAVIAKDLDSAQDSAAVLIDATPPDTALTSTPPDPDNDPMPTFEFSGDDGGGAGMAYFEWQVDAGGWMSGTTGSYTTASLADGPHTFEVRAVDNVGWVDATPASHAWTVDTTPPAVPTLLGPADTTTVTTTDSVTLTWQAVADADLAGYTLDLGGSVIDVGDVTQYVAGPLANGAYTWTLAAYDALGNASAYADDWSFEVDKTLVIVPGEEASGTFVGAEGVTTTITLPAGAVVSMTGQIEIKYHVVPEGSVPAPPSGSSVIVFDIELLQDGAVQAGVVFSQPITIAIAYDPALVTDPSSLELYYLDASDTWANDGITIVQPIGNPLVATLAHLTKFNLIEGKSFIYLPLVMRNYP